MKLSLLLLLTFYCRTSFATLLPKNDLWVDVDNKTTPDIVRLNQEQYQWVVKKVGDTYTPVVEEMGKTLKIFANWEDGTVNAYADRKGDQYELHLPGGMARFKNLSIDGYMIVVCHELGHNIGGLPKYRSAYDHTNDWAVNEGQSDYWATVKCMKRILMNEDNIAYNKTIKVESYVTKKCTEIYPNDLDRALCERIAMGAKSLSAVFQIVNGSNREIFFEKPSRKEVLTTKHSHPDPQCRMDTLFQGALCDQDIFTPVSETDINQGLCVKGIGARPRCWYHP